MRNPTIYRLIILGMILLVAVVVIGGVTYIAGTIGAFSVRSGTPRATVMSAPVSTLPPSSLARFGAIDPALLDVLDYGVSPYGAQAQPLPGIQPVGVYLARPEIVQPAPRITPTPLPLLDDLSPLVPTLEPNAAREAAQAAASLLNPDCAPAGNPAEGVLTQAFHIYHSGIDISASLNTPVRATHSGIVIYADWSDIGYGYLVVLRSGRFTTYYAHNNAFNVQTGDLIQRGAVIAWSGSTGNSSGPHIHYETRLDDRPLDPLTFERRGYESC